MLALLKIGLTKTLNICHIQCLKLKAMAKYTFIEFIVGLESDNFDELEKDLFAHYNKRLSNIFEQKEHDGDCTKAPYTCDLCLLEHWLREYKEYIFNEQKWREDNGA